MQSMFFRARCIAIFFVTFHVLCLEAVNDGDSRAASALTVTASGGLVRAERSRQSVQDSSAGDDARDATVFRHRGGGRSESTKQGAQEDRLGHAEERMPSMGNVEVHEPSSKAHASVSDASAWCHCDLDRLQRIYGAGFEFSENYQEIAKLLGDFHSFLSYNPEVFHVPQHGCKGARPGEQSYALDGGSLIGWERHKSVIPYDTDADVLLPKSFFSNIAKYAVMNGLGQDNKQWITLPLVGDAKHVLNGVRRAGTPFSKKIAIIYQTQKIGSVDEVFRDANVTHVLALSNYVYREFGGGSRDVFTAAFKDVLPRKAAHGTNIVEVRGPQDGVISGRFFMRHQRPTVVSMLSSPNMTTAQMLAWEHGGDAYTQLDLFPFVGVTDCSVPLIIHSLLEDEDFPPTEVVALNNVHVRVFSSGNDRHNRVNACYAHREPVIEHPDKVWDDKVKKWVAPSLKAAKSTSHKADTEREWKWGYHTRRALAYASSIGEWVSHSQLSEVLASWVGSIRAHLREAL